MILKSQATWQEATQLKSLETPSHTVFRKNFFKLLSHVLYFNPQNTSNPLATTILTYMNKNDAYSLTIYIYKKPPQLCNTGLKR